MSETPDTSKPSVVNVIRGRVTMTVTVTQRRLRAFLNFLFPGAYRTRAQTLFRAELARMYASIIDDDIWYGFNDLDLDSDHETVGLRAFWADHKYTPIFVDDHRLDVRVVPPADGS